MNSRIRITLTTLASIVLATSAMAQDQKEKAAKAPKEKTQEIVIRKKGDKGEKMTIVVDGDNVTINGKPVDEFKNNDVTIFKREPIERSFRRFGSGGGNFG